LESFSTAWLEAAGRAIPIIQAEGNLACHFTTMVERSIADGSYNPGSPFAGKSHVGIVLEAGSIFYQTQPQRHIDPLHVSSYNTFMAHIPNRFAGFFRPDHDPPAIFDSRA